MSASLRRQSPARVQSSIGSKTAAAKAAVGGHVAGRISTPSLSSNAEKLVKRAGSLSPGVSDCLKLQGAGYQKPKPSMLAGRASDADVLAVPQLTSSVAGGFELANNKAAKRPAARTRNGAAVDAEVPAVATELTVQVVDGPRCGGCCNNASASNEGEDEAFVPEDEEPFVPEEDVQGSVTQGDNLMFAKARMRRQNSPGGLPGSPSLALGSLPSSPGASIMFVPQQSS